MNTRAVLALGLGGLLGLGGPWLFNARPSLPPAAQAEAPKAPQAGAVAADGVLEGARPEVSLRAEVAGAIAAIFVRENQQVRKGDLLAELRNASQKGQVALAGAELAIARADRERLRNGERAEKRRAAAASEMARQAVYRQAEGEWLRSCQLVQQSAMSREEHDAHRFHLLRAKADWEQSGAERELAQAAARPEELDAAEGRVAAAEARLRLAEADLAKTRLRAPSDGCVLQVFAEPGEVVAPTNGQPVLLLADLSRRRVRAFVDELDVARVRPGQPAAVTADCLPGQEFRGRVALVARSRMGKRAPHTDQPDEYKDVYFQEVLIDLESAQQVPVNLRVRARILTSPEGDNR